MFDFDGTLFRSWEKTPEWWVEPGAFSFFVKPESLDEPCVPENPDPSYWISPAVNAARSSSRDRNDFTVVITGRVAVHRARVQELLRSVGVKPDGFYLNPGMSASQFKVAVFKTLLVGFNSVDEVVIWENENTGTYKAAIERAAEAVGRTIRVEINKVDERPKPLDCGPEDFAARVAGVTDRWFGGIRGKEASVSPLDLQRLAARIERLQQTRTHGWHPGDELEFRNYLPGGRGRQQLPDPARLREVARSTPYSDEDGLWLSRNWRNWVTWAMRAEGLIGDNDPRNPRKMMRDMARGKFPGGGW